MTLFDLLFLASALVLIVSLARLAYQLIRRRTGAKTLAGRIGAGVAVYFAALFTASAIAPSRIYAPGERHCFDDWCIAVTGAESEGKLLKVRIIVSSRALRVNQRERGVTLSLADSQGRQYEPLSESGPALDTAVAPGEQFEITRTFHPLAAAKDLALIVKHSQGPGAVIIASDESLFHRPSLMKLSN